MREQIINGMGEMLRDVDPANPGQFAEAEALAGGALTVAMAFLQDHLGKDAAGLVVSDMFEQAMALRAQRDGSTSAQPAIPVLHPEPQKDALAAIKGRAEAMLAYLERRPAAEADVEARASIWAGTAFVQRRAGDRAALDFMSFIRAKVGVLGWFEQLPVDSQARH